MLQLSGYLLRVIVADIEQNMPVCSIVKCGSRKSKNQPELTLHRFPRSKVRNKWIEIIGADNLNPRHKQLYVCSLHYEEKCFNRTLDVMRLHVNAVPLVSFVRTAEKKWGYLIEEIYKHNATYNAGPDDFLKRQVAKSKGLPSEIILMNLLSKENFSKF